MAGKKGKYAILGLRKCYLCGEAKELNGDNFHRSNHKDHNGFQYRCKPCDKVRMRVYNLRKQYGLTTEQWELMISQQGGLCKICKKALGNEPMVDHCHSTNRVRGILCDACNRGLGYFRDSPLHLQSAIEYLQDEQPYLKIVV